MYEAYGSARNYIDQHRLKAAAMAGVAVVGVTAGIVGYNAYEHRNPLLSPQKLGEVCAQSEISLSNRSDEAFKGPLDQNYLTLGVTPDNGQTLRQLADIYFPYDTANGLKSLAASNPGKKPDESMPKGTTVTINISNVSREVLPANSQITSIIHRMQLPPLAVECLNGIGGGSVGTDTKIVLPIQSAGGSWMDTHIFQKGETYASVAGTPNPEIFTGTVPESRLRPGDILFINTRTGTNRFMQPQEAAGQPTAAQAAAFYNKYGAAIRRIAADAGMSSDFLLAQNFHESQTPYGLSEAALKANNLGGVKAGSDWHGRTMTLQTWEHADTLDAANAFKKDDRNARIDPDPAGGYKVALSAKFKAYDTVEDFLHDQVKLFRTVYTDAWPKRRNPYAFLHAIVDRSGPQYATDPRYIETVAIAIDQMKSLDTANLPSAYSVALKQKQQQANKGR